MQVYCNCCQAPTDLPEKMLWSTYTCPACGRISDVLPTGRRQQRVLWLLAGVILATILFFIALSGLDSAHNRTVLYYIQKHAHDRASLKIDEWGKVERISGARVGIPDDGREYVAVRLKYRAKEPWGEILAYDRVFVVWKGEVVLVTTPEKLGPP